MKTTFAALTAASLAATALGVNFPLGSYVYTGSVLAASLWIILEAAVNACVTLIIWLWVRQYARKRE